MCGIAGAFGESNDEVLTDMIDCISHRGPDDSGKHFENNFMMGMRRLSIVGVDSGHQPIHNEDEDIWTVFNGEIYNYQELKEQLEDKGHDFYTEADTEVLVHLYEEHGEEFVEKLNGMYAFAIWDKQEEKLLIYRDRLGIKPLYYAEIDGSFYFGSEVKSILQTSYKREPDLEALSYYWRLSYIPAPYTAFEGVKKLEPGHYMKITEGKTEKKQYWSLKGTPDQSKSFDDYAEELRELLEDSVEKRMMADVPLGAFLSGGLDSSITVGLMSKFSEDPINTFSVIFEEEEYNEAEYSRYISEHFETNHTEYEVSLDTADRAEEILEKMDEPLADAAVIPTHIISEKASEEVKVVNTGSGSDELFAGYGRYRKNDSLGPLTEIPIIFKEAIGASSKAFSEYSKPWYYSNSIAASKSDIEAFVRNKNKEKIPIEDKSNLYALAEESFQNDQDWVWKRTDFDIKYWLPDDLLTKVDRSTMNNSLEARVPFLDHRLVEFSRQIPSDYKIDEDNVKKVLKKSVEGLIPEKIIEREKDGFGVPTEKWMKNKDNKIGKRFQKQKFEKIDYLDEDQIIKKYRKFKNGKDEISNYLWKALCLQIWHEQYIEGC